MLDWFRRRKTADALPEYSAVRTTPNRGLPADLAAKEGSEEFRARREAIEASLREPPRRPQADRPLFVELLSTKDAGVWTITLPESGARCLPIFSSPIRAADYIRTLLEGAPVKYVFSSPLQLTNMLSDLRRMGIEQFTLDRCPRCDTFTAFGSASVTTTERVVDCWSFLRRRSSRAWICTWTTHGWRRVLASWMWPVMWLLRLLGT